MNRRLLIGAVALLTCLTATPVPAVGPSTAELVRILQDESEYSSAVAIASVGADASWQVRLARTRGIRAERIARRNDAAAEALASAGSGEDERFDEMFVSVITPNLERNRSRADSNGMVNLTNLVPGLNILVVTGSTMHGVLPFLVQDENAFDDAPQGNLSGKSPFHFTSRQASQLTANMQVDADGLPLMVLADTQGDRVLRLVDTYLANPGGVTAGEVADIDTEVKRGNQFSYRVHLGRGGILYGQVFSLLREGTAGRTVADTNIIVFQNNRTVGRAISNEAGEFELTGMQPGTYGLIAAGPAGYASLGFEALPPSEMVRNGRDPEHRFVTVIDDDELDLEGDLDVPDDLFDEDLDEDADVLPVICVPPPLVPPVIEAIRDDYARLAERENVGELPGEIGPEGTGFGFGGGAGLGGPGGGLGGGGAGSGVGGDFGSAFVAAAAVAAAAAAADNDDSGITIAQPASPVLPTVVVPQPTAAAVTTPATTTPTPETGATLPAESGF